MKGFPKTLSTKEDYYNCLAMVASGELAAADLLGKIDSLQRQRYVQCAVIETAAEKKAATIHYCDEAAAGMVFLSGDVVGTVTAVTHVQSDELVTVGEQRNDRTVLTLSKGIDAGSTVIGLQTTDKVAGMTADDITALKGVLKQYE